MKCPKCQREHTLKRAENNTIVCAACGSRLPLKTPVPPPNVETTYSFRSEPTSPSFEPPTVSPPPASDNPFAARAAVGTSSDENRPSLFSWSGRATQREFLIAVGYYLLYSLLGIVLCVLGAILGALSQANSGALQVVAGLGTLVVGLAGAAVGVAATIILLAASARRLRDAGASPYLTLLHFVVSLPLTIFLAVYPGETGKTDAAAQPQTSEKPRSNATQNAPSSFTSAETLGWRRFFSWNAPAQPTDLPIALGAYLATAVLFTIYTIFDVLTNQTLLVYFVKHDLFEKNFIGHVALDFIQVILLFFQLAIFALNLTALGVSILTLAKGTRK